MFSLDKREKFVCPDSTVNNVLQRANSGIMFGHHSLAIANQEFINHHNNLWSYTDNFSYQVYKIPSEDGINVLTGERVPVPNHYCFATVAKIETWVLE